LPRELLRKPRPVGTLTRIRKKKIKFPPGVFVHTLMGAPISPGGSNPAQPTQRGNAPKSREVGKKVEKGY